ncbi:MAG: aspartate carbamoyltransferase [Firmicutes bacterium]|nr:aspartate carbamoyltransferase [Bacillota bacterium]
MEIKNKEIVSAAKPSADQLALLKGKDILSAAQFTKEELDLIMETAAYYEKKVKDGEVLKDMEGKVMASLFFEPSTRTRLSFETAMSRLGGSVITVAESAKVQTSSTAKGETLYDSIRVIDLYADVIVVRSPQKGAADEAALAAENPVLNSGDGAGEHPTQALLDIYTILKERGDLKGLTVTLLGDLKHGRTVHSLIRLLSHFGCHIILVAPEKLRMPAEIVADVEKLGVDVKQTDNLSEAAAVSDVLYVTRIQKERFENEAEYDLVKNDFIVESELLKTAKEGIVIMHPLPRVNEITVDVDDYAGAAYFRQAGNGVPVRMALLALVKGCVR